MQHLKRDGLNVTIMDASLLQDHESFVTDAVLDECIAMLRRGINVLKQTFPEFSMPEPDNLQAKVMNPEDKKLHFSINLFASCEAMAGLGGSVKIDCHFVQDRAGNDTIKQALGTVTELDEFYRFKTGTFSYTFTYNAPEEFDVNKNGKYLKVFLEDIW